MKAAIEAFFERITRREKMLIAALFSVFTVLTFSIGTALAVHHLTQIQDEIEELETALVSAQKAAPAYMRAAGRENSIEDSIRKNQIDSLRIPINDVAKKINLTGDSGETGSTLADLIRFEGKVVETPVLIGAARKKKKNRTLKPGMYILQLDQEISIRELELNDLYNFTEKLEASDAFLFLTRFEAQRTYNNYEKARISMVVTTYTWPPEEPTE